MKLKFLSAEFTLEELAEGAPFLKKLFVDVLHYHRTPKDAAVCVLEKFIFVRFDKTHSWVFYMDEVKDEAELTCICEAYKTPRQSTVIYSQEDKWFCWAPQSGHKPLGLCYNEKDQIYVEHWPEGKSGVMTVSWFKNGELRQRDYRDFKQGNFVGYYGCILKRADQEYDSEIIDFLYHDDKGAHLLQKRTVGDLRKKFNY